MLPKIIDDIERFVARGRLEKEDRVIRGIVKATYRFDNGMIATFDYNDEQMPELQGRDTPELRGKIKAKSDERTKWNGFHLPTFS